MPQYRHSCPVTTRFIWMCGFPRIDRTMRGTGHELTILCVARQRAIGLRKAGSNASHHTICIYHGEPHIILFRLWSYEYLCDRRSFAWWAIPGNKSVQLRCPTSPAHTENMASD